MLALFGVLFLWQMPHFYAIAWIYRDDYARAGLRMLPVVDPRGARTGRQMVGFCMALLAVSLLPWFVRQAGPVYLFGAAFLGLTFLIATLGFVRRRSVATARRVMRASLVYLPLVLVLLVIDRICGLGL
jgi:protoheme IX farnesyltransferase